MHEVDISQWIKSDGDQKVTPSTVVNLKLDREASN